MPELPEVETVANELNHKLKNRKVADVEIRAAKIVGVGPATLSPKRSIPPGVVEKFKKIVLGQKFVSVRRRAKLLIFDLSGPWSMLVHLKMTGQFIFEDKILRKATGGQYRLLNKKDAPKVALPAKHTHVIFYFADKSVLYFNDVRKFGYLKLVHDTEVGKVREFLEYGPEPLDKKFTLPAFLTQVKKRPKGKIKQVLMDNKVVVGIGNIYSDEILFHAKVRPTRKVSSLKPNELVAIYRAIGPVLKKGIKAKGSSVGDFVRTDGSWGGMGKFHFVYGRKGQKCKKCGSVIQVVKLGGRTGSYCPKCQV
ncbi:MAG: DNA-formamidopyrimidine glycosylase [Patescibacteria group bacterium]|nr:DNA-formamidopyrimidine glycosylase [Patescibacteria group bacterium]